MIESFLNFSILGGHELHDELVLAVTSDSGTVQSSDWLIPGVFSESFGDWTALWQADAESFALMALQIDLS